MSQDFIAKQQARYNQMHANPVSAPAAPGPVTPATNVSTPTPSVTQNSVASNMPATPSTVVSPTAPVQTPEARQSEILKNLSEGYAHAPQLFANREAFNQAYNYNTKPANERAVLDSFYASKQPQQPQTGADFFNIIASGAPISPMQKNNPSYIQAQKQWSTVQQYMGANGDQIYAGVQGGTLIPGSDSWNYLAKVNPLAIQQYQKKQSAASYAQTVNSVSSNVVSGVVSGSKDFYGLVKS